MKEREEFLRRIAQSQLLSMRAYLVLKQSMAKKLSGAHPFIIPADGRQKPLA